MFLESNMKICQAYKGMRDVTETKTPQAVPKLVKHFPKVECRKLSPALKPSANLCYG